MDSRVMYLYGANVGKPPCLGFKDAPWEYAPVPLPQPPTEPLSITREPTEYPRPQSYRYDPTPWWRLDVSALDAFDGPEQQQK
jgi:hypothetical protein